MRENKLVNIKEKSKLREKNITAAVIVMLLTTVIMVFSYIRISKMTEQRCLDRAQEIVSTVTSEISDQLMRDSQLLYAVAQILSYEDSFRSQDIKFAMMEYNSLTPTTELFLLLPGDLLITPQGYTDEDVIDVTGKLSFEEISRKGEQITGRRKSIFDNTKPVIYHYMPVYKNGKVTAVLFSSTDLEGLPDVFNIDNMYNGEASAYIVDRSSGDLLMDTLHEDLGNIRSFSDKEVKKGDSMKEFMDNVKSRKSGYTVVFSNTINGYMYFYYEPMVITSYVGDRDGYIGDWTVCISVPESEVLLNLFMIRKVCILMVALEFVLMVVYLYWTIHNTSVTLEKAVLEERLVKAENAERAKTMFLSNMSHDIRTPMNAIIGYTTLAATNIDNKERIQDYLSKILSSSNHLLSLINDILDMSRIESGRVDIEEIECSLPDMLQDLRNILQSQIQAKQLNFFIDTIDVIDEDVYCDKLHLNQVLLNLVGNAIKFTPSGGSVTLIFKQKHGAPEGYALYEIHVKDTGIGMSADFMKHVFEPFERESTSTVSGIQGTGLGMAIAKNIIDMMGGTIEVFSEQGKGTEYIITLELRLQTERKQVEVVKELEGFHALVVDDDFNICDSVTKMLVQLGLRANWTMSGKEAVLHAKQAYELADGFDVYIIDWQLPDLNGIEIVRRIRAFIGDTTPIIILTAYDWSSIEDEAREAGVTAFCNKPIFISTLRAALLEAMGKSSTTLDNAVIPKPDISIKGKRILLVEDNELNREIAEEILTESGLLVECAEDGTVAVEKVKNSSAGYYDLILMDVQMPIMNGYEATKQIRNLDDKSLADIPIVAMTANAFNEDQKQALDSGMNDHIAKPLDIEMLFEVLKKYLDT